MRRLDHTASLAMISGLIAYGWAPDELSKCQGPVAKKIGQYMDLPAHPQHNLLGLQTSEEDNNRDSSVSRDNTLAARSNEGKQLSMLASVALSTARPSTSAACENRPLDLSSSHRMEHCDGNFTYDSPGKYVYRGSAVELDGQCNPHHWNENITEPSMTDETDLETPEIQKSIATDTTNSALPPFLSPKCFLAGE